LIAKILTGAVLVASAGEPIRIREDAVPGPRHTTPLPPPRDGNIAIREELDAARRADTVAAYDLFIARHPDHPLTRTARQERARLVERVRRK